MSRILVFGAGGRAGRGRPSRKPAGVATRSPLRCGTSTGWSAAPPATSIMTASAPAGSGLPSPGPTAGSPTLTSLSRSSTRSRTRTTTGRTWASRTADGGGLRQPRPMGGGAHPSLRPDRRAATTRYERPAAHHPRPQIRHAASHRAGLHTRRRPLPPPASNSGAAKHPGWYLNLVANPTVTIDLGTETFPAKARTGMRFSRGSAPGPVPPPGGACSTVDRSPSRDATPVVEPQTEQRVCSSTTGAALLRTPDRRWSAERPLACDNRLMFEHRFE